MAAKSLRRKPKQSRSSATVDVIVTAAAQVLLEHGYPKATTNRIAERAGVSVGSVYQYFDSKDEIFAAVLQRYIEQLVAVARSTPMSVDMTLQNQIEVLARAGITERPEGPRLLLILSQSNGDSYRRILDDGKRLVADHLSAQLETQGFDPGNLELRLGVAMDAIEGLFLNAAPRLSPDDFAREASYLVSNYLGGVMYG